MFRAVNVQTEGLVAVKRLKPGTDDAPGQAERLKREVRTLARLSHPNTVRVYDCGETDTGELFVVMELLRGRPLSDVLRRDGPLPAPRALAIARQVLAALEEAHEHGVGGRDFRAPSERVLAEWQAAGRFGGEGLAAVAERHRSQGYVLPGDGDPRQCGRHAADGGRCLIPPLPARRCSIASSREGWPAMSTSVVVAVALLRGCPAYRAPEGPTPEPARGRLPDLRAEYALIGVPGQSQDPSRIGERH